MRLEAPAKLTWTLEVTGRRPDGYHELRSEMCSLDLVDVLEIDENADYLEVVGAGPDVTSGEDNLVARALRLVQRRAGVRLEKVIPSGGGLGGGSADAAAILRWAKMSDLSRALELGSDVPFCLVGGRALVEGVGETVTPLSDEERVVTLLLPGWRVSTAAVYRAFDEGHRTVVGGLNDLEAAARVVEPRLGELLDWGRARYDDVRLAGSGSTVFVVGEVVETTDVPERVGPLRWIKSRTTPRPG